MTDLHYINQGLFTAFVPVSKAGEEAWNELAKHTDGTGKVFTVQAESTIAQLRKAGYTVRKAPKVSVLHISDDDLFNELTGE